MEEGIGRVVAVASSGILWECWRGLEAFGRIEKRRAQWRMAPRTGDWEEGFGNRTSLVHGAKPWEPQELWEPLQNGGTLQPHGTGQ